MNKLPLLVIAGTVTVFIPYLGIASTADRFVYPVLASGVTDPTQNTTNPDGNGWSITNGFGNDCPSCACSSHEHQYHPGYDISQANCAGKPVYAVAGGTVARVANVMADPNDHSRGYYILIQHTLPQTEAMSQYFLIGTTVPSDFQNTDHVTSAYLHVDNVLVQAGDQVGLGEQIAEIFDASSFGDHLHFEMRANWDTRLVSPDDCLGYYDTKQDISDFGYVKGWSFIGDHLVSTVYRCQWKTQNTSNFGVVGPNQTLDLWVEYWNRGTATWKNSGTATDPARVELASCNSGGQLVPSWFTPVGWISNIRVKPFDGSPGSIVPTDGYCRFTFQARTPSGPTQANVQVWFRPTHGGLVMEDWGGLNWTVSLDATAPNPPTNLQVSNPEGGPCPSNPNFTISWTAATDGAGAVTSGIQKYKYWFNGVYGELTGAAVSFSPTSTQVRDGTNTFVIRAVDGVGNESPSPDPTLNFCWDSNPVQPLNLSFDEDADSNNIPDGWSVPNLSGYSYQLSGGADPLQPRYVQFTNSSSSDQHSIGRALSTLASVVTAGQLYRLSFWYKTISTASFEWQLDGATLTSVGNPLADVQWHHFWSQPISFTQTQIDNSTLTFVYGPNRIGTVGIDWVNFEPTSLCP